MLDVWFYISYISQQQKSKKKHVKYALWTQAEAHMLQKYVNIKVHQSHVNLLNKT